MIEWKKGCGYLLKYYSDCTEWVKRSESYEYWGAISLFAVKRREHSIPLFVEHSSPSGGKMRVGHTFLLLTICYRGSLVTVRGDPLFGQFGVIFRMRNNISYGGGLLVDQRRWNRVFEYIRSFISIKKWQTCVN